MTLRVILHARDFDYSLFAECFKETRESRSIDIALNAVIEDEQVRSFALRLRVNVYACTSMFVCLRCVLTDDISDDSVFVRVVDHMKRVSLGRWSGWVSHGIPCAFVMKQTIDASLHIQAAHTGALLAGDDVGAGISGGPDATRNSPLFEESAKRLVELLKRYASYVNDCG